MDGSHPIYLMDIKRFFAKLEDCSNDYIYLRGQEFVHAKKVLRQKVGYIVIVSNGDGYDYQGVIEEISNDYILIRVTQKDLNKNEISRPVVLYQCIAKENDFIVQKAVELGITEFVPVLSQYVNAKFNMEKLETIATQASKQCERAKIMKIRQPISLSEAVKECSIYDVAVFPYENATDGKLSNYVAKDTKSVAILIGCEGGFTNEEAEIAADSGFKIVTLGPRILRAETAAVVTMGIVLDCLGELQ